MAPVAAVGRRCQMEPVVQVDSAVVVEALWALDTAAATEGAVEAAEEHLLLVAPSEGVVATGTVTWSSSRKGVHHDAY